MDEVTGTPEGKEIARDKGVISTSFTHDTRKQTLHTALNWHSLSLIPLSRGKSIEYPYTQMICVSACVINYVYSWT